MTKPRIVSAFTGGLAVFGVLMAAMMVLVATQTAPAAAGEVCVWEGKAPLCNGKCRPGYTLVRRSKKGNGKKCITGSKAKCISRDRRKFLFAGFLIRPAMFCPRSVDTCRNAG